MELLYRILQNNLKSQIIAGIYKEGDLLPSENELQKLHKVTRSTVRHALSELVIEGYIHKQKGKGSIVLKLQRRTLGVLSVKGFSEIVSEKKLKVSAIMLQKPFLKTWPESFFYPIDDIEQKAGCIFLKRLRCVEGEPIMLESTYIPNLNLPRFCSRPFVNGSLFETLNVNYSIEITRVEQDMRAILAEKKVADHLRIDEGSPLLLIYLKFYTKNEHLSIYSSLLCNTEKYSIGNKL
jgi:GntR family transcriptional regulator/GntR family frlABCD operon transcriptional regulator